MLVLTLVFGARRIPEIGASLGQGIREFKRSLRGDGGDTPRSTEPPGDAPKRLSQ